MRYEPLIEPRSASRRLRLAEPSEPPRHDARMFTEGGNQAEIRLDGVRYLLRIARHGKLILTK